MEGGGWRVVGGGWRVGGKGTHTYLCSSVVLSC